MVVPALATLLSDAAFEVLGNLGPLLSTFIKNKSQNFHIFLFSPGTFYQLWIKHFLPSVKALDIGAAEKRLGNLLPVLAVVLADSLDQL